MDLYIFAQHKGKELDIQQVDDTRNEPTRNAEAAENHEVKYHILCSPSESKALLNEGILTGCAQEAI